MQGHLMTPREVGATLGFSTARPIYRLIREGKLSASRIGTRLVIAPEAVETLVRESTVGTRTLGGLRELERECR